jgi:ribose-phosphate pyrophosphokinase
MTTLATTDPAVKGLFERLDFSPHPESRALAAILQYWGARRAGRLFPQATDIRFSDFEIGRQEAFLYRAGGEGDFSLVAGGTEVVALLGTVKPGDSLSAAPNHEAALRLRRILEVVCSTGEPLLAEFSADGKDDGTYVEVLAAPLSDDGHGVSGIFGGIVARPVRSGIRHQTPAATDIGGPVVFALGASRPLGEAVCSVLGTDLSAAEERSFEDGEHKTRSLVNVRNRDVYVVSSLDGDNVQSANDKLCRLLFFIGALKDAAASSVTAVVPYLCYSRKDRQTKARDPVTTRYVAQLFEAVGTDRVMTLEAHNIAAFQNAFRCDTEHLDADRLFAAHFRRRLADAPLAVVSPDPGGVKRAERLRQRLEDQLGRPVTGGFMDKHRSGGVVTGELFAADVEGRTVIIVDDMISTGGTMARMATACRAHGAGRIYLAATHGLFSEGAEKALGGLDVDGIVVTNSVPPRISRAPALKDRIEIVDVAGLVGEAIRRCHSGESIVELLGEA